MLAAGVSALGVLAAFGGGWRWPFAVLDGVALATAGALGVVAIRRATHTTAGNVARGLGYALAVLGFAASAGAAVVALTAAVGVIVTLFVGLALVAIVIVAIHLAGGF